MESLKSAAPASVIDACTQDCANFTSGRTYGENNKVVVAPGEGLVGEKQSIFQGEGVVQSEDVFRTRLCE